MSSLALSVLDLIPVRRGQTSNDAVAATLALADTADRLGYRRYWLAEHHNMPSVASTTPPVLISAIAARTERIRVGSGGVMLPNHAPLVVAEQFAALEAIAPGRIDLGLGRAPGSDPIISALLNASGTTSDVSAFGRNIEDIRRLLSVDGAVLSLTSGQHYDVRATPNAAGSPTIWLLGSSDFSAQLAAELGLPYVFAHHFSGEGTERALGLYREGFQPSESLAAPLTFLTANVSVADTATEARAAALPQLQHMARLMTRQPLTSIADIEEAAETVLTAEQQQLVDSMSAKWIIDEPIAASERLRELAARFEVDEVMVSPAASAHRGVDPRTAPGRERTLELLAGSLLA